MRTTKTPPTYFAFRAVAVAITVLMLVLFGLGLHGRGPFHGLGPVTSNVTSWLHANTGMDSR
jgi:hypothetical protein